MTRRKLNDFWGHIEATIAEMIESASDGPVETEFNGVTIFADHDSDPALLYRDWSRALSGYIPSPIGPHPATTLSPEELAHDAKIERQNAARREEADRQWREKAARERAEYGAALSEAPAMKRDEAKWQEGVSAQKSDGYGLAVYGFAEAWARLMQAKIADGGKLADIADDCCSLANKGYGITGFMYGCAVRVLAHCWKHGEELRRWHNLKTQLREEGERANESGGVLNPALLIID